MKRQIVTKKMRQCGNQQELRFIIAKSIDFLCACGIMKQLMAGGGVALIGGVLVPLLSGLFS